jgi:thiol:disulfide interchange protein DsbC
MKKLFKRALHVGTGAMLALGLLISTPTVLAAEDLSQPVPREQADYIRKAVEAALGANNKVSAVYRSPYFGGLYEVKVGNSLLYTDAKVTNIMSGSIFDPKTLENLTEDRLNRLNAIRFQDLPLELALKTVRGKGTRQVAVFEDPNCSYCKRFRKTLLETDDATIYTFVLAMLGPDSLSKTRQLLCAADKNRAWDDWMLRNRLPNNDGNCNAPAERLQDLGKRLNVTGTPTIIFGDGTRAAGAISPSSFEARMAQASRALAAGASVTPTP